MNDDNPPTPAEYDNPGDDIPQDARTMAMACHLASVVGYVIPFGSVIGPLIVWIMKRDDHPFIDRNGKEALNFNISIMIWAVIGVILLFCFWLGLIILIPLGLFHIVMMIIASIKAYSGEEYSYPLTFRLVK